ncbi:MAG: Ku protein [Planctomycetales bacterium]
MARPIWKGQISFGLVNVPVTLYSAEQRSDVSFKLIDSRNAKRVRYERVNEATGEEVPWGNIVKGYEYDDEKYVLLSERELASASPELTRTIEIDQFVDLADIEPVYFERPYYLVPAKGGEKGYVLLREAMAKTGRVGLAGVVIRARQYLSALVPQEHALILELLRYPQELRAIEDYDVPGKDLKKYKVTAKEIDLAAQLIEGMTADWSPEDYHDEYRDALMKLIEKKIKSGQTKDVPEPEVEEEPEEEATINFMSVLKQSVERTSKGKTAARAPRKNSVARRTPKPKRKSAG